jgi:hypothetical protein
LRKSFVVAFATAICSGLVAGCTSSSATGDKGSAPSTPASSTTAAPVPSGNATIPVADLGARVLAAMKASPGFRLVGTGSDDSGKPVSFDIHFGTRKISGSVTEDGQKIELISLGTSSLYFRLARALWKQLEGADAAATFSGKWVKVPVNEKAFKPLEQIFDRQSFVGNLLPQPTSGLNKAGPETVDGVAATKYLGADGVQVFIAASGPPVILKTVDPSSKGGTATFSGYDSAYSFAAPPAGQTIDLSKAGS